MGGIEITDLKEILEDLWSLGWPEDQMNYLRSQIASYQGAYSEVSSSDGISALLEVVVGSSSCCSSCLIIYL